MCTLSPRTLLHKNWCSENAFVRNVRFLPTSIIDAYSFFVMLLYGADVRVWCGLERAIEC